MKCNSTSEPKVIVFPSNEPPPRIEKQERGTVYLWFDQGKMHILQNGIWHITPYFTS